ncbi:hypothetical protein XELAEV_18036051mg [Xenopus laevis]|uniref:IRF tryptophan pentad repeat domain-containing protein n=1 Tax=Xenopus laevis TaxID=8355 RepID=A0A974CGW9_XENLA|nr:hypothetical protein XELAEV_18036051mg [Xenopus laevis]
MSAQKPHFLSWVLSQIDSQRFPGLEWMNQERTLFRVPWKHGSRQDLCEDNYKIFKAWAIVSGKYNPQRDEPDLPTWKRNFRSALRQNNGVRMIQNNSLEPVNPHKVYELKRNPGAEDSGLYAGNQGAPILPLASNNAALHGTGLYLCAESQLYTVESVDTSNGLFLQEAWNSGMPSHDGFDGGATAAAACTEIALYNAHEVQNKTKFKVEVYYRGTLITETEVNNPRGFYVTSQEHPAPGPYLEHMEHMVLPAPTAILNQKVAKEICRVLEKMKDGVCVEMRDGSICGKRQGKCRVFYSMTKTPSTPDEMESREIDKYGYTVLYSLQQFISELTSFLQGTTRESPRYTIWMCLGEAWPDDRPWEKKFVMVKITPIAMKDVHELSYRTGASSLQSDEVNLQFSDSFSSLENMLSLLKDMGEIMEY